MVQEVGYPGVVCKTSEGGDGGTHNGMFLVSFLDPAMNNDLQGVDRGNMKITHLSRLPQEAQCTLTVEDWLLFRK